MVCSCIFLLHYSNKRGCLSDCVIGSASHPLVDHQAVIVSQRMAPETGSGKTVFTVSNLRYR